MTEETRSREEILRARMEQALTMPPPPVQARAPGDDASSALLPPALPPAVRDLLAQPGARQDRETVRLTLRLSKGHNAIVEELARRSRLTKRAVLEQALEQFARSPEYARWFKP